MKKRAFTLIELLIIIAIIAILVGVAMPYYQDYIKQAKLTKAEHELQIIKEALIQHDTMEELPFRHNNLRYLLGKYMQDLPRDPWDRDYHIDWVKAQVWSDGPDTESEYDDIKVEYKPPLTLLKATWLDMDNNSHITKNDIIRLEFSRCLYDGNNDSTYFNALTYGKKVDDTSTPSTSLIFTGDVDDSFLVNLEIATYTASSSELLLRITGVDVDNPFYPGSTSMRVGPSNNILKDWVELPDTGSGIDHRKANGSEGTDDVDWIRIKGR